MPTTEQMKQTVEKQLNAFCAGDWNTFKQCFADSAVYDEEATHQRVQGADKIVQTVEPWRKAFPDVKARIKDSVGSGDALVIELDWEGTQGGVLTGPFGTLQATKKKVKVPAVQVVRFDGDRIREIRHYFDMMTLLTQLGVKPQVGAQQPGATR